MLLKLFNRSEDGTLIEKVCRDIIELNEAFSAGWATAPHLIKKVEQAAESALAKVEQTVEDVFSKKDKDKDKKG